eukprot:6457181-Amphidinium_carterae.2
MPSTLSLSFTRDLKRVTDFWTYPSKQFSEHQDQCLHASHELWPSEVARSSRRRFLKPRHGCKALLFQALSFFLSALMLVPSRNNTDVSHACE